MKNSILVTGSNGMVGSRFVELFPHKDRLFLPNESGLDITNKKSVEKVFNDYKFTTVINFAAYTNVNEAEDQREDVGGVCWKVNVDGVKNLVDSVDPKTTQFIHISTDMVFSGNEENPGPYSEDELPDTDLNNLTWYGYTKAEADRYLMDRLEDRATIIRIIYPVRAKFENKSDYLRKPLELYDEGKLYPLITDQQVSISFIDEIAEVLNKITNERLYGVFHVSSDLSTPYELVSYSLHKTRSANPDDLKTTTLDDFINKTGMPKYRYPKKGGLKAEKTSSRLGIKFRTWKEVIEELISQGFGN